MRSRICSGVKTIEFGEEVAGTTALSGKLAGLVAEEASTPVGESARLSGMPSPLGARVNSA